MADQKLLKKLKLAPGMEAAIIHAPPGYLKSLGPLPPGVSVSEVLAGVYDWVQVFAENKAVLEKLAPHLVPALQPAAMLWISFLKGTSNRQTDLTRDAGWDAIQQLDLKWVNLISIDDSWSAFGLRPYRPGEERQSFR